MKKLGKAGGNKSCNEKGRTIISAGFEVFLLFVFLSIYPLTAYATAPTDLKLAYNPATQTLQATITHASPAPSFHYIKKVEIKKNGEVISSNEYNNQPDRLTFSYTYEIPAAEGDVLEVTASCNIWGSKTEKLTIGNK